ncbi:MAG TPA: dihydroxyacetone kinase subunit DhaL [Candidatus Acidoferrum sp.]|nr:dihydroxyacetone kinase subunit DhaL [Candidatus Acidoferrum sp.]
MKDQRLDDTLSYMQVLNFLSKLANQIIQEKDRLNSMDAVCGDGDFGTSMYIAFSNVRKALEEPHNEIGTLLTSAGHSILCTAGGASGALFGTFFVEAGKHAKGKTEVALPDLAIMFDASMKKIQTRGEAQVGDKTMIDSLEPAVRALQESAKAKSTIISALQKAAAAAEAGCDSTKDLVAKHGRSRYLGEQTLGHADPGAYVMVLVFRTLAGT